MPSRENLLRLVNFPKSYLCQLNLFNTGTENETIIQNDRRSTRLYLVLIITSMIIFVLYHSVVFYTEIVVIHSPSLAEYSRVKEKTLLRCPCSNAVVRYGIFAEIEPVYHQLCQSDLVSDAWISDLFHLYEQSWNTSIRTDFRRIAVFQFQTLRSLCKLAKETISKDFQAFRNTGFAQSQLILPEIFEAQINSFIHEFINEIPKAFLRTLNFIQDITAQSLFMTGASITSVRPVTQYRLIIERGIVPYPGVSYTFTNGSTCVCSSLTATTCMGLATFDNNVVPGFQTGCYMLSALLNSTLEVFHNQTFINELTNSSRSFQKLNSSNSHWKIEKLLGQMFVESWSNRTSFEKYFQSCAPDSCSYRRIQRRSFWDILLWLIGLSLGLSTVFKLLASILIVKIWPIVRRKICRRISSDIQDVAFETISGKIYSTDYKVISHKLLSAKETQGEGFSHSEEFIS